MEPLGSLSIDDAFEALADAQRRKLLVALLEHNPQDVTTDRSETDDEALERLILMKHAHLPKLEGHGFIEWDQEHGEVHRGPNFEEIRPLLELLADHEDALPAD